MSNKMKRTWFLLIGFAFACNGQATVAESLPDHDAALAHRLVEQEQALLLDVRSTGEFQSGHIDHAINIPHDRLSSELDQLKTLSNGDKDHPFVVYCATGRRADIAKRALLSAGYKNVTNLGGVNDW